MDKMFAGIDVSTQGLKFIIINLIDQVIVYNDSINYDKDLPEFQTLNGTTINQLKGVSESNPLMWIDALNIVFKSENSDFTIPSDNIFVLQNF